MTHTVTASRVTLRPTTREDLPLRVQWLNDPEVTQFTAVDVGDVTLEGAAQRFAARTNPRWTIEVDSRPIGCCDLRPDEAGQQAGFGIVIGEKDCWGRGYGTAALREVLRIGFEELGLHRVHLRAFAYNHRGIRCYSKCGFRCEGVFRQSFWKRGQWVDQVSMAILREEWEGTTMVQTMMMLQGERVLLRPLRESDLEESVRVWTPELRHLYGGRPAPGQGPTMNGRHKLLERVRRGEEGHFFALETDGRYIGFTALRVSDEELSARLRIGIENPEYWGRGYGTEAVGLLLRYAFEALELHRVSLRVAAYNARARRCYEKCGFRVEGIERHSFQVDGEWQDDVLMAILKDEWEARQECGGACDEAVIRPYRSADHPAVLALLELTGFHPGPNDAPERIAWKLATQPGFFFVAEADGQLVGTIVGSLERGWGWIQRLSVHPDCRRRGLARRLLQEAERAHAALGAYRMVLLTHRDNEAAQALYRGQGYELWEGVIVMSREFAPRVEAREEEDCCGN